MVRPAGGDAGAGRVPGLFCRRLAGAVAVPGSAFGLEPYFRVSYATSLDLLNEAMNRIEKAILTLR